MIYKLNNYKTDWFSFQSLKSNIGAGFVTAIISLPLYMALSLALGIKPEYGLYTAIISNFVVGIFGGTYTQISGPSGVLVVVLSTVAVKFGIDGVYVVTLIAGIILILMGLAKTGGVIRFIPYPVLVGFTSGIGILMIMDQSKHLFGINFAMTDDISFYGIIQIVLKSFISLDQKTTFFSLLSFLIIISCRHSKTVPSYLLAMVIPTAIQFTFDFQNVETIGSVFGHFSQALPVFKMPNFDKIDLINVSGPAFMIALLIAIQSILSAVTADSITETKHNSNKELIGQGFANILTSVGGGFASAGSLSRTIMNIQQGGNSPIAAIVHSLSLLSILLFFAPYAIYIPFPALATILVVMAFNMIDIPELMQAAKNIIFYDSIVLIVTFLLTVFAGFIVALSLGVILSLLFLAFEFCQLNRKKGYKTKNIKNIFQLDLKTTLLNNTIIYTIQGPLFFGTAQKFEYLLSVDEMNSKFIVFSFKDTPFMDKTGLMTFTKILTQYYKKGIEIYICETNKKISRVLLNSNILNMVKLNKIFHSLQDVEENG